MEKLMRKVRAPQARCDLPQVLYFMRFFCDRAGLAGATHAPALPCRGKSGNRGPVDFAAHKPSRADKIFVGGVENFCGCPQFGTWWRRAQAAGAWFNPSI
jgi:hypothetical protein